MFRSSLGPLKIHRPRARTSGFDNGPNKVKPKYIYGFKKAQIEPNAGQFQVKLRLAQPTSTASEPIAYKKGIIGAQIQCSLS